MGGKKDRFDEYGQLAGGYDVAIAREKALEHAQTQLPEQYGWLKGLELYWEIESARFDEDEDCYKVILSCYPKDKEVQEQARFEYHIDATGKLYPGTPLVRARGKWRERGAIPQKTRSDTIWWISLVLVFILGFSALAIVLVDYNYDYIDIWWAEAKEAKEVSQSPGSATESGGETVVAPEFSLTVSSSPSSGGYVSPSGGTYDEGTSVTLTAYPNSGYEFDHWGGDASGYSSSTSITMNSSKSVVAYFKTSTKDSDGDGLTDVEEATLGTNAFSWDTDGDGINDPDDYCPTYDGYLKVEITRFDSTGDLSDQGGYQEAYFFIKVNGEEVRSETTELFNGSYLNSPYQYIFDIPDDVRYASVSISAKENDAFNSDDDYDISGSPNSIVYSKSYDITSGTFTDTSDGKQDGALEGLQGKINVRLSVVSN